MLDLNFCVAHRDSMEDNDIPSDSATHLEDSGASNSSFVNAEEAAASSYDGKDEDSSNAAAAAGFIFDIVKKKKKKEKESEGSNWVVDENAASKLVTQPFFPVAGNGRDWDSELRLGLRSPCLNLSFSDSSGGAKEVKSPRKNQQPARKNRRGPRSRSSQYRGVTFYRRTGRWESHIWDCGKQVYLGGFDTAHAAARAYDRAAIKFRGTNADINFNTSDYEDDLNQTKNLTKEEFVYVLRRHSSRFSRGSSNIQASTHRNREDDLDLSLGISKNSEGFDGSETMGFLGSHFNGGDKLNAGRTKDHCSLMDGSDTSRVDGPRRQPQTAAMVPYQPSIFGSLRGLHQSSSSSSSSSSLPQHGFANWAWREKRSGMVSPVPIFTVAASSGFSSFTTHHPR